MSPGSAERFAWEPAEHSSCNRFASATVRRLARRAFELDSNEFTHRDSPSR